MSLLLFLAFAEGQSITGEQPPFCRRVGLQIGKCNYSILVTFLKGKSAIPTHLAACWELLFQFAAHSFSLLLQGRNSCLMEWDSSRNLPGGEDNNLASEAFISLSAAEDAARLPITVPHHVTGGCFSAYFPARFPGE